MSGEADVLRDLAHAKAVFQLRAITAAMGVHPETPATGTVISRSTSGAGGHRIARASVSGETA